MKNNRFTGHSAQTAPVASRRTRSGLFPDPQLSNEINAVSPSPNPAKIVTAFALAAFLGVTGAKAQIAGWNFFGESITTNPTTSTADLFSASLDSSNLLSRGAGAAASAGANSFRTVGFQNNGIAITNTDYFQFTLSATDGNTLSLSTIDATFAGTASFVAAPGVTSQFAYSLDGTNFTLIGSPVQSTSLTLGQVNLSTVTALQNVVAATTVTLRYYASGQTPTGGWGFTSPNANGYGLAIGGSVSPVFGAACYWVGADAVRGDIGTWSQSGGTSWATTDADVAGTAWDSSKTATFGGSVDPSLVTVSGTVNAAAGISFASTGYTLSSGTVNLTGANIGANLVAVNTGTATIASAITGANGMTVAGGGTLIIAGADSHAGGTTITGATLQVGDGATAGSITGNITDNGTLTFNRTDDVTFSGDITGSGNVTKLGSNTLTLGGNNSHTGATTVSAGALRVTSVTALGTTATGTTVVSDAALELSGGVAVGAEVLTLNGTGVSIGGALRNVSGASSYAGGIVLASDSRINSDASTLTLSGGITGAARSVAFGGAGDIAVTGAIATTSGAVSKDGSGTLTLSGVNTYTSVTAINAGTVAVSGGSAIADAGAVSIADAPGAIFKLNASETIGSLSGGGSTGGSVNLQANTLTVGDGTSTSFAGTITGIGGILTKQGNGTLTVSGANSYTGVTNVNAGTLKVDTGGSLGSGPATVKATLLAGPGVTIGNNITMTGTQTSILLAGWDFQTTTNGGTAAVASAVGTPSPLVYVANFGTGTIYLDGTNSSSTFTTGVTNPQVTGFSGTALNAGPGFSTSTSVGALALANNTANGKFVVFNVNMSGLSNLAVSYATQNSGTGFTTQTWEYSTDGSTWNSLGAVTSIPVGTFGVQTLSPTAGLNNAATAYVRLTGTGASASGGNNRLDNIQFNTPGPVTGFGVLGGDVAGTSTFSGAITLNANASVTAAAGGTVNFTGTIGGSGGITKIGAGLVDFKAASNLSGLTKLTATEGTTDLHTALGTGTSTISVTPSTGTAALDIFVSQTLASLTIGNGGVVTITAPPPPAEFAPGFEVPGSDFTGSAVAVPEPGAGILLLGGLTSLLGLHRRR